ncbi:MAG: general secretion pathway protein GspB [Gammaproteobacteria bacterium]|nr:general secretion pathway protein GspB [Gammaproteobacteria bacterium]
MKRIILTGLMLFTACAPSWAVVLGELPDPTRPLGGRAATPLPAPAPVQAPANILQSILIAPQRRLAMINGRMLSVGDHLDDAVVTEIQPYEVVLQRGGQEVRMRLLSRLNKQAVNRSKGP